MTRRPPRSTRTDTLFPYTTLFRSFETRCKMIREGLGVGIVPEMIARNYLTSMGLVLLRLDDEWASRSFFACVHNPEECDNIVLRSEEHTSELQSLMRISYAVFCLKKKMMSVYMMVNITNNKIMKEHHKKKV